MTSATPTLARVSRVIADALGANVTEEELRQVSRLDEIIAVDSIALLELVVGLEREFAIRLDPSSMKRDFVLDIAGLTNYLETRTGTGPQ
jgi:acyl carrier protein